MSLSRTNPKPTQSSFCHSRLLYRLRRKNTAAPTNLRVTTIESETFLSDNDRLLIEVSYARNKVLEVHQIADVAESQLTDLLNVINGRKKTQPPKPTVVISRRLEWSEQSEDIVASSKEPGRKSKKAEAALESISNELMKSDENRLLTSEEEKILATRVQRMVAIAEVRDKFVVENDRQPTWTEVAEVMNKSMDAVKQEYQEGLQAKHEMINKNMGLVISIAAKMRPETMRVHDLVVDGAVGLIRAIERFDPEKGAKLSTYAHSWIKQNIRKAISEASRLVTVPSNVSGEFSRYLRARERLTEANGVYPSDAELARDLDLSEKRFKVIKNAFKFPVSLDDPVGSKKDREADSLGDTLEDPDVEGPEEYHKRRMMKQDLELALSALPEKEALTLRLRYGLDDGCERTLDDVTRERVRQIEARAIRRLRQRSSWLKEYTEPTTGQLRRSAGSAHLKS